jgi:hypothetical protein
MVYILAYQKSRFGYTYFVGLGIDNVGMHRYFMSTLNILWSLGVLIFRFGMLHQTKSGNPAWIFKVFVGRIVL